MRIAFLPVQLLDGFRPQSDNVRGRLPGADRRGRLPRRRGDPSRADDLRHPVALPGGATVRSLKAAAAFPRWPPTSDRRARAVLVGAGQPMAGAVGSGPGQRGVVPERLLRDVVRGDGAARAGREGAVGGVVVVGGGSTGGGSLRVPGGGRGARRRGAPSRVVNAGVDGRAQGDDRREGQADRLGGSADGVRGLGGIVAR